MEAPQDVIVSFVDYQSVLLSWRGVYTTIREEPLEGYIVSIHVQLCFVYVCFCFSIDTVSSNYKSDEFFKCTHTHIQPFYSPRILSGTTQVSLHQKGKTKVDLLEQEIVLCVVFHTVVLL